MNEQRPGTVKRLVIAGGGTAGWMTATAMAINFNDLLDITLIESEEIGTVGVGESTVPPLVAFHGLLGLDEQHFMRTCAATFKLGIGFENWGNIGDRYIHPFGLIGKPAWICEFQHFWLRSREQGSDVPLGEYCQEWLAAKEGKFGKSAQPKLNYAYHFDAALYAKYLRKICEARGVKRVEGKIRTVQQHATTGFIESLTLDSGKTIEGDLFIDCTGFRGLLIEQTLHTGYEDWSHWLACDSAAAFQTITNTPPAPYTGAIAHEAGWRWNIPLQHRVGNGVVFCNRYMSDDEAIAKLVKDSGGTAVRDPWLLRLRPGRRRKAWNKNVISVGLASGFVEPLESTSIHMIMTAVVRLMHMFPFNGIMQPFADRYNDLARAEIEGIRDFVVLHYHATQRDDSRFWRYCRGMEIPESLARRIDLFRKGAYAYFVEGELFRVDSWISVMLGQGIVPETYHRFAQVNDKELFGFLAKHRAETAQAVAKLPSHQEFLREYCGASTTAWEVAKK